MASQTKTPKKQNGLNLLKSLLMWFGAFAAVMVVGGIAYAVMASINPPAAVLSLAYPWFLAITGAVSLLGSMMLSSYAAPMDTWSKRLFFGALIMASSLVLFSAPITLLFTVNLPSELTFFLTCLTYGLNVVVSGLITRNHISPLKPAELMELDDADPSPTLPTAGSDKEPVAAPVVPNEKEKDSGASLSWMPSLSTLWGSRSQTVADTPVTTAEPPAPPAVAVAEPPAKRTEPAAAGDSWFSSIFTKKSVPVVEGGEKKENETAKNAM